MGECAKTASLHAPESPSGCTGTTRVLHPRSWGSRTRSPKRPSPRAATAKLAPAATRLRDGDGGFRDLVLEPEKCSPPETNLPRTLAEKMPPPQPQIASRSQLEGKRAPAKGASVEGALPGAGRRPRVLRAGWKAPRPGTAVQTPPMSPSRGAPYLGSRAGHCAGQWRPPPSLLRARLHGNARQSGRSFCVTLFSTWACAARLQRSRKTPAQRANLGGWSAPAPFSAAAGPRPGHAPCPWPRPVRPGHAPFTGTRPARPRHAPDPGPGHTLSQALSRESPTPQKQPAS